MSYTKFSKIMLIFLIGFAYVEYEHSDDAAKAVKYMDAGQIDGQEISVATVYPARQSLLRPPRRFSPPRRGLPPSRDWRRSPPRYGRSPPRRDRSPRRSPPRRSPPRRRSPRRSPPRRRSRSPRRRRRSTSSSSNSSSSSSGKSSG